MGAGFVLALVRCSSGGPHQSKAAHTAFPQVIYQQGGVLAAPKVITVTFPGDPLTAEVQSFGQSVASSSWWNTIRAGYCETPAGACVGDGPAGTSVVLTAPPEAKYTDSATGGESSLQAWLAVAIGDGTLPPPDTNAITNTIYAVYFPQTTVITLDGTQSCVQGGFDGYHNSMTMGSQQVVYAVIAECATEPPPFANVTPDTLLQSTTVTTSHEIVEASTDPSALAFSYYLDFTDPNTWGWLDVAGGEVADLCVDQFGMNQDQTTDGPFTVQRIWSNTQAAAGSDPCNPIPTGEVYFNAAPRQLVFIIDVGSQATFDVDAFSDGPMDSWTLSAQDWSPSTNSYLSFSIAGATSGMNGPQISVNDGATVQVTVTLLEDPGSLPTGEADGSIVSVSGDLANPTAAHYWPFIVMSPGDALDSGLSATTTSRQHPPHSRRHSPRPPFRAPNQRLARPGY
jgi:hypothetical protein